MKVLVSTPGRFHSFALARELYARNALAKIATGFPWAKVARENVPRENVVCAPALQLLRFGLERLFPLPQKLEQSFLYAILRRMDDFAASFMREADVFVALSGSGLRTGSAMRAAGKIYVCDRGSAHILEQKRLLEEEAALFGAPKPYFHPGVIARELAEYEAADAIAAPSLFARRSFLKMGVPEQKILHMPYGVNLQNFHPTAKPDAERFDVLFVGALSLRKGLPYLLDAFGRLRHPKKKLTLVGAATPETRYFQKSLEIDHIDARGTVPHLELKELMSRSHVMILPSVEEGFGLVMGEALACGCPVIASENTGAADLFEDGREGFIVPIRSAEKIHEKLEFLAAHPHARENMSQAAVERTKALNGWGGYGELYFQNLQRLHLNAR